MGGRKVKINSNQRNRVTIKRDIGGIGIKEEVKRVDERLLGVQGGG